MIECRSKAVFKQWLNQRPNAWRGGIEVVAIDGFTGYKTAPAEELPKPVAVMDPFHVVRLAVPALDDYRRRTQHNLHGQRGMKNDPLYTARQTLHTGQNLLANRQRTHLVSLLRTGAQVKIK